MSFLTGARLGDFDVMKAIAAVGVLVQRTGESMYPVMKMLYLADKMHLERYGRFIAGDSYCAMSKGPVASHTYNMIKTLRGRHDRDPELLVAKEYLAYSDHGHMIKLKQQPDLGELSKSDIECLNEVAGIYKSVGANGVKRLSHDASWKATWAKRLFLGSVPMPVESITSEFTDGDRVLAHVRDPNPGSA